MKVFCNLQNWLQTTYAGGVTFAGYYYCQFWFWWLFASSFHDKKAERKRNKGGRTYHMFCSWSQKRAFFVTGMQCVFYQVFPYCKKSNVNKAGLCFGLSSLRYHLLWHKSLDQLRILPCFFRKKGKVDNLILFALVAGLCYYNETLFLWKGGSVNTICFHFIKNGVNFLGDPDLLKG